MKKIFIALLFISSAISAQVGIKFTANKDFNLGGYTLRLNNGPLVVSRYATGGLPTGVRGLLVFDSTTNELKIHNGTAYVALGAGGGGSQTFQQVLTTGSTLTGDNTVTIGTNLFTINSNSATKFHISATGKVSINGTGNGGGYGFYVNDIFGGGTGGTYFVYNGTDIQYNAGTGAAAMKIFGGTGTKRWDWTVNNNGMTIAPQTDNTLPFLVTDNASVVRLQIDFGTPKTTINSPLSLKGISTAPGAYNILVKNLASADSLVHQISGGLITGGVTNAVPRWGSTTTLVQSGITDDGSSIQLSRASLILTGDVTTSGSVAYTGIQAITSGTATTIAASKSLVQVNPGSVMASHTITTPASPVNGQEIRIVFGGTIAGNAAVVTTLTISANSGQTLMQASSPTTAVGGDCIIYQYISSNTTWYRIK